MTVELNNRCPTTQSSVVGGTATQQQQQTQPQPQPPKKNALDKAFGLKTEEEAIGAIVGIVVGIIILICLLYVAMRPTRKPKAKQGPVKKPTSRK